jgi:hypothetical protein
MAVSRSRARVIAQGTALLTAFLTSASGFSQTNSLSADLRPLASNLGITTDTITHAFAVLRDGQESWMRGISGGSSSANLSVSGIGQSNLVNGVLKISYNALATRSVVLESCTANGKSCQPVDLKWEGSTFKGAAFGALWNIDLYGNPCESAFSCSFILTSWSLKARLDNSLGDLETFPGITAIIEHSAGLTLFDVERAKPWLSWPRHEGGLIESMGRLNSVQFFAGFGLLDLAFENGHLLMDFPHDRAYAIRAGGIFAVDDGLANFDESTLTMISAIPAALGTDLGPVIGLSPFLVVWQKARAAIESKPTGLGFHALIPAPGQYQQMSFTEASETSNILVGAGEDLRLHKFSRSGEPFGDPGAEFDGKFISQPRLIGRSLFDQTSAGLFLLNSSGKAEPTSLATTDFLSLLPQGIAFKRTIGGSSCRWVNLTENAEDPKSFRETGMSAGCATLMDFSAGNRWATMATRDGGILTVHTARIND